MVTSGSAPQAPGRFMMGDSAQLLVEEAWLAEERRRVAAVRAWRAGILEKVRDGRLSELKPEERGWILSVLQAECPEVEA